MKRAEKKIFYAPVATGQLTASNPLSPEFAAGDAAIEELEKAYFKK